MADIPYPDSFVVSTSTIEYLTLYQEAQGGPEPPWVSLAYGANRKLFWSNFEFNFYASKPTEVVDGVIVHLPDPSLNPTD